MKKFIKNCALFSLGSLLVYVLALLAWGTWMPNIFKPNLINDIETGGMTQLRLEEAKTIQQKNILFLGSSHTYRSFDPRIFEAAGYSSFNLGTSSQSHLQTEILLQRYFKQIQPKLVVYEVYPETFLYDGLESGLDLIKEDTIDFLALQMSLKINNIKAYNALVYEYFMQILGKERKTLSKIQGVDTYIQGGFVARQLQQAQLQNFQSEYIHFSAFQLNSFKRNIQFIKDQGCEVLLVFAPIPPSKYKLLEGMPHFDTVMQEQAHYIDFNTCISLNDTLDFYDANHLNQKGVTIFNPILIDSIKRIFPQIKDQ